MSSEKNSIIESSFISPENKGLLSSNDGMKEEQEIINNSKNVNSNSEKEPLVIPNSFISSSSETNVDRQSKRENNFDKVEAIKKNKNNLKMKNNVKKVKPKLFNGNKITRITNEEWNDAPIDDCWVILQSIKPEFHSVRLSKKHINECYIGRHERNYIQINSDLISSLHCKIFYKYKDKNNSNSPIEVYITDTSTNGTYINGDRIGKGKTRQIYHGQEIGFIINSKRGQSGAYIVIIPRGPDEIPGEYERSIEEDYQIGELLGSGNFATVKKGIHRYSSENVAIKILDKRSLMMKSSSKMVISLEREINILKSIKHKNIIQIFDVYEDEKYVYLVLELAKGGELFDKIKNKPLTEPQARRVMKQLLEAMEYLHNQGIAHRDLKPENILIDDNKLTIKISDFGLARFVDENFLMKTLCGTLTYAAPEVISIMDNKEGKYTIAVDMWSCGVVLFVCLCGYLPFNEGQQVKKNIQLFRSPYWDNISDEAKDLVKGLLTVDPSERLTVRQALEHPFIVGHEEKINPRKRILEESDQNVLSPGESVSSYKHIKSSVYSKDFSPSRSLSSLSINEEQQSLAKH